MATFFNRVVWLCGCLAAVTACSSPNDGEVLTSTGAGGQAGFGATAGGPALPSGGGGAPFAAGGSSGVGGTPSGGAPNGGAPNGGSSGSGGSLAAGSGGTQTGSGGSPPVPVEVANCDGLPAK